MRLLSLLPLVLCTTLSLAQHVNVNCIYTMEEGHYTCAISSGIVQDPNRGLTFTGLHMTGRNDGHVTRIRNFRAGNNVQIHTMHNDFVTNFPNLQVLELRSFIRNFPENSFNPCRGLTSIDISSNGFSITSPGLFADCGSLRHLDISNNNFTSLPDNTFAGLNNLETLNVGAIEQVTATTFNNLVNLRELRLRSVTSINTNSIRHLLQLRTFACSHSPHGFNVYQSLLNNLRNLVEIHLSNNGMTDINFQFLRNINTLQVLRLEGNNIETTPESPFNGTNRLIRLDLQFNRISSISREFFTGLENLEHLDLSFNRIHDFPENSFQLLSNLRLLILSGNRRFDRYTWFPLELFNPLTNLNHLRLNSMRIRELRSEWFQALTNLQSLEIASDWFTRLPPAAFSTLINLTTLNLSFNEIRRLNANSFGELPSLTSLVLTANKINEIERQLFLNLPNLRMLMAWDNNCIDANFANITEINFEGETAFDACFENWKNIPDNAFNVKVNILLVGTLFAALKLLM